MTKDQKHESENVNNIFFMHNLLNLLLKICSYIAVSNTKEEIELNSKHQNPFDFGWPQS